MICNVPLLERVSKNLISWKIIEDCVIFRRMDRRILAPIREVIREGRSNLKTGIEDAVIAGLHLSGDYLLRKDLGSVEPGGLVGIIDADVIVPSDLVERSALSRVLGSQRVVGTDMRVRYPITYITHFGMDMGLMFQTPRGIARVPLTDETEPKLKVEILDESDDATRVNRHLMDFYALVRAHSQTERGSAYGSAPLRYPGFYRDVDGQAVPMAFVKDFTRR